MIQLNLLPDVKLEYIRAQRSRRLVTSVSILVTAAAIIILVLLLGVDLAQKKHLSDLNRDINQESSQLKNKPNINKILTVQNQLESLTTLHNGKPDAARLFNSYLDEITPEAVSITSLHVDFTQQTVSLTGTADSLATVNKYVDTLKFTTYTTDSNKTPTNAFSDVVLASFGLTTTTTNKNQDASYNITLSYDPNIFDTTQKVTLSVPHLITTRSELGQPGDLFKAAPAGASGSNSGGQ